MGEVVIAQNEVVNAKTVEIAKTKLQMTKRSCNCKNEFEIFLSAETPHKRSGYCKNEVVIAKTKSKYFCLLRPLICKCRLGGVRVGVLEIVGVATKLICPETIWPLAVGEVPHRCDKPWSVWTGLLPGNRRRLPAAERRIMILVRKENEYIGKEKQIYFVRR